MTTAYPGDINDCYKIPSKGGIPIEDLRRLAQQMGINAKGMLKAQICDEIRKLLTPTGIPAKAKTLTKTRPQRSDDDDDVDITMIRRDKRKEKPVKKAEEKAPEPIVDLPSVAKIRIKSITPIKMPPPPPPAWYVRGERPELTNIVMRYAMGTQHYDWIYYILGTAILFGKTPAHNLLNEYIMKGVIPESLAANIRKDITNIN